MKPSLMIIDIVNGVASPKDTLKTPGGIKGRESLMIINQKL